jgi:methylmalonyl-CoA mutase cobalamin-binding domain/chain
MSHPGDREIGSRAEQWRAATLHASQGAVGLNLTRSLPEANIVRGTHAGLAGVRSGAQSVGLRTMDEAYGIPSAKASLIALRTLQIIGEETGVTSTVDPLAGSYLVEWLTDEVERRIRDYLNRIDALGGMVSAIKAGYVQGEIAQSAFPYERDLEEQRRITVGMNLHADPVEADDHHACYQLDPALQAEQIRQLGLAEHRRYVAFVFQMSRCKRHCPSAFFQTTTYFTAAVPDTRVSCASPTSYAISPATSRSTVSSFTLFNPIC